MAQEECCIGRGVAAVRHKSGSRSYTYYAMKSLEPYFGEFEAEGTVFGSIGGTDFHGLRFLVPDRRIVAAFHDLVDPIDELVEVQERQNQTLTDTRDALLPKLMSGEIRVGEAERRLEDRL